MITKSMSFPNMFNYITNKVNTVSGEASIEQCIGILLRTGIRELLGDPEYGSQFHEYIFNERQGTSLDEIIRSEIVYRTSMYEHRISLSKEDIQILYENNRVYITLDYRMNATGEYKTFSIELASDEEDLT